MDQTEQENINPAENQGRESGRFEINDTDSANWYLRKLRIIENEKATILAQTAAMIKALEAETNQLEFRFGQQFQVWAKAELIRRGGKSKTLALHQGTAAFRTVPASFRVRSAAEAMEYARQQGWDIIKTVESLDADSYKKQAIALRAETGELIPGIEVTEERESFSIKYLSAKDSMLEDV